MGRETGVALPSARDAAQPWPALTEIGFKSPSARTCLAFGVCPSAFCRSAFWFIETERLGVADGSLCAGLPDADMLLAPPPVAVPDENALAPAGAGELLPDEPLPELEFPFAVELPPAEPLAFVSDVEALDDEAFDEEAPDEEAPAFEPAVGLPELYANPGFALGRN